MDATSRRVPLWYLALTVVGLIASVVLLRPYGFAAQVLAELVVLSCLAVAIRRRLQT
jgi:hypothetical protein